MTDQPTDHIAHLPLALQAVSQPFAALAQDVLKLPGNPLLAKVLDVAAAEVGVHEEGGANRGPRVEEYLLSVGLGPGFPWCAAFVHYVWREAAFDLGLHNPVPMTGKVATLWRRAVLQRRGHPFPGAVFVHLENPDNPASHGHCGIVTDVAGATVQTIEGNSNDQGSREGVAVVRHERPIQGGYITGWLDFADSNQVFV